MDSILEIKQDEFVELEIRKSKFLAFSFSIHTIKQFEEKLSFLKSKYSDSTHICYAYKLGGMEKAYDDGEPQGTAGKPILDCIKKKGLNNIFVAVIRYFGGIKLGAGGLIRAYSNSAKTVIDMSQIIKKTACYKVDFEISFDKQKYLKNFLSNMHIKDSKIEYLDYIKINLYVEKNDIQDLVSTIRNLFIVDCNIDENEYYLWGANLEHYFLERENQTYKTFEISQKFFDRIYYFNSSDDVFSKNCVDYGTYVLINTVANQQNLSGRVLDIGCGYGPIGIVLASINPNSDFVLADVNGHAVELSKINAKKNNIKNISQIIKSDMYENIFGMFDYIITNPPIKAGKQVLEGILFGAYQKLNPNGKMYFVIKKKFGENSLKKKLKNIFASVEVIKRDKGYYILEAQK